MRPGGKVLPQSGIPAVVMMRRLYLPSTGCHFVDDDPVAMPKAV